MNIFYKNTHVNAGRARCKASTSGGVAIATSTPIRRRGRRWDQRDRTVVLSGR